MSLHIGHRRALFVARFWVIIAVLIPATAHSDHNTLLTGARGDTPTSSALRRHVSFNALALLVDHAARGEFNRVARFLGGQANGPLRVRVLPQGVLVSGRVDPLGEKPGPARTLLLRLHSPLIPSSLPLLASASQSGPRAVAQSPAGDPTQTLLLPNAFRWVEPLPRTAPPPAFEDAPRAQRLQERADPRSMAVAVARLFGVGGLGKPRFEALGAQLKVSLSPRVQHLALGTPLVPELTMSLQPIQLTAGNRTVTAYDCREARLVYRHDPRLQAWPPPASVSQ